MNFIKNLNTMGKKSRLDDLQGLNEINKKELQKIIGGEEKEIKPRKKSRWPFSISCGGHIQQ